MTCLGHSLRSRAPSVHNKPFFFLFCLCCTYTWDEMDTQIRGSVPGSIPTCLYLGGHLHCVQIANGTHHHHLPDPPSLLLHLILCSWSWVMAPLATHSTKHGIWRSSSTPSSPFPTSLTPQHVSEP